MDSEDFFIAGLFGGLGAATTIAWEQVSTKWGHQFKAYSIDFQWGINAMPLIGIMGAIQNVASLFLASYVTHKITKEFDGIRWKAAIISHASISIALVGVTALANRVNLISGKLTLFAGCVLFVNSVVTNLITLKLIID